MTILKYLPGRCCLRKSSQTLDDYDKSIVSETRKPSAVERSNGHVNLSMDISEEMAHRSHRYGVDMNNNSAATKRSKREVQEMEMNVYETNRSTTSSTSSLIDETNNAAVICSVSGGSGVNETASFETQLRTRQDEKQKIEERIAYLKTLTETRLRNFYEKKTETATTKTTA